MHILCALLLISCAVVRMSRADCFGGFEDSEPAQPLRPGFAQTWEQLEAGCAAEFYGSTLLRYASTLTDEERAACGQPFLPYGVYEKIDFTVSGRPPVSLYWSGGIQELEAGDRVNLTYVPHGSTPGVAVIELATGRWGFVPKTQTFECALCQKARITRLGTSSFIQILPENVNTLLLNEVVFDIVLVDGAENGASNATPTDLELQALESGLGKLLDLESVNVNFARAETDHQGHDELYFYISSDSSVHFGAIDAKIYTILNSTLADRYRVDRVKQVSPCPVEDFPPGYQRAEMIRIFGLTIDERITVSRDIQVLVDPERELLSQRQCIWDDEASRLVWTPRSYWRVIWKECSKEQQDREDEAPQPMLTVLYNKRLLKRLESFQGVLFNCTNLEEVADVVNVIVKRNNDLPNMFLSNLNSVLTLTSPNNGADFCLHDKKRLHLVVSNLETAQPVIGFRLAVDQRDYQKQNSNSDMQYVSLDGHEEAALLHTSPEFSASHSSDLIIFSPLDSQLQPSGPQPDASNIDDSKSLIPNNLTPQTDFGAAHVPAPSIDGYPDLMIYSGPDSQIQPSGPQPDASNIDDSRSLIPSNLTPQTDFGAAQVPAPSIDGYPDLMIYSGPDSLIQPSGPQPDASNIDDSRSLIPSNLTPQTDFGTAHVPAPSIDGYPPLKESSHLESTTVKSEDDTWEQLAARITGVETCEVLRQISEALDKSTKFAVSVSEDLIAEFQQLAIAVANIKIFSNNGQSDSSVYERHIHLELSTKDSPQDIYTDYDGYFIDITYLYVGDGTLLHGDKVYTSCVSWNPLTEAWTTKACRTRKALYDSLTVCRCRAKHMTQNGSILTGTFAIKKAIDSSVVDSDFDPKTLTIFQYAGSNNLLIALTVLEFGLSSFGLLSFVFTAICYKPWRDDMGHKILLQMVLAITLNLAFGFTTDYVHFDTESVGCIVVGVLRHYSFLAMFMWMLVLSGLQMKRLMTVAGAKATSHLILKVALFAWGVPLLPIIVLLAWNARIYRSDRYDRGYCYPEGLVFQLTVQAPAALILVVNLLIFVAIVRHIFECGSGEKITKHSKNEKAQQMRRVATSVFIFFLFGFTWVLHYLSEQRLIKSEFLFEYLFLITATTHISVLSLFFVILDDKARAFWLKVLQGKPKSSTIKLPPTTPRNHKMAPATSTNRKAKAPNSTNRSLKK